MAKKLYRSRTDRMLSGLIGGIGEYFDVDATILRIAYVFVTIFGGILPGVLVYIVGVIIVPLAPESISSEVRDVRDEPAAISDDDAASS